MMSCFVVDLCWFIYLLFIMLLVEISECDGWFECFEEVFEYYWFKGVEFVVCEEKYMGLWVVVVVCKDWSVVEKCFWLLECDGIVYI